MSTGQQLLVWILSLLGIGLALWVGVFSAFIASFSPRLGPKIVAYVCFLGVGTVAGYWAYKGAIAFWNYLA